MANILVIHGPNLNMLGNREEQVYGKISLEDINTNLRQQANKLGHKLAITQSNAEHEIINSIQNAKQQDGHFIIINPAAYTHTSVAIRDALLAVKLPFIEVHLSNIYAREPFRHHSYLRDIANGVIIGLGANSYYVALTAADLYLSNHT